MRGTAVNAIAASLPLQAGGQPNTADQLSPRVPAGTRHRSAEGRSKFAALLADILEDADNALPYEMRVLLAEMLAEWDGLGSKIDAVNRQLVTEAKSSEACGR